MSGEVPAGWSRITLGDVIRLEYGRALSASTREPGSIPVYGSNGVCGEHSIPMVSKRGIVVGRKGTAGSVTVTTGPFWPIDTTYYVVPRIDVDFDWLAATLEHARLRDLNESTGVPGLNRDKVYLQSILLPPLDEQQRIAEVLRSVDETIGTVDLTAVGAKAARMALLANLFHRGDWEPERALPSGWRTPNLDQVAKRGSGHTPNKQFPSYWDGDVKWISLQDTKRLDRVYIAETAATITSEGIANSSAVLHPADTVVVSRDATVGKSAIMASDMAVSQHFIAYTCGAELSPLYFYYWLQRMKPVFERIGAGSTIKTIGLPFFKSLKIAIPPRAEQDRVAKLLWETDSQILANENVSKKLQLMKAALTSDLLTGRVRIPAPVGVHSQKTVQPAFKRAVFAAEVVHQLHADARFGAVKHEKIVHLCELHVGLQQDLDRHAYKKAAGPYDPKARRSVETIFRQQKWFNAAKPDGKAVVYQPLENCGQHATYFQRYFGERKAEIQAIIDLLKPMKTEQCEIVATLYAVWNDFMIDGVAPSDDQIVASVLTDWHPSKTKITKDRWLGALPWMRDHGLTPRGLGEKTRTVST